MAFRRAVGKKGVAWGYEQCYALCGEWILAITVLAKSPCAELSLHQAKHYVWHGAAHHVGNGPLQKRDEHKGNHDALA